MSEDSSRWPCWKCDHVRLGPQAGSYAQKIAERFMVGQTSKGACAQVWRKYRCATCGFATETYERETLRGASEEPETQ